MAEERRWADRAFDEFWAAYPRKVGKLAAKREWDRIRPTPELVKKMGATLAWQCEAWTDPQFIPHPRTWLHQGRWDDEPPAVTAPAAQPPKSLSGVAEWMRKRAMGA